MGRARAQRGSALATVVVTALILLAEMAFLTVVYHLDDPVDQQRVTHAELAGSLSTWGPGRPVDPVLAAAGRLAAQEAPGAPGVLDLARDWAADPAPERTAALRAAVDEAGAEVVAAQAAVDRQASWVHAAVLVAISTLWFLWFRRLVRRHRELERRLTAQQAVDSGRRRLLALVRNSTDLVAVLDPDSTATFVSPAAAGVLGRDPASLTGKRFTALLDAEELPRLVQALAAGEGEHPVDLRVTHTDGRRLTLEGTVQNLLADPDVCGLVLTVRDVTERRRLEEQMAHQAFHDDLTGLANRQLFRDRVEHALRRRAVTPDLLAVVVLDLDDFKHVNDSQGHQVGDRLLVEVADRIRTVVRAGDTAARLGGDEFGVLVEGTGPAAAAEVAERLLEVLAEPVVVDGEAYSVQASLGVAEALPGLMSAEELLRNADVAMYWAKDRGKGTVACYEAALHDSALSRLALRGDLQRAIRDSELVLYYQPLVDLERRTVVGFEALVRWQHPERGLLPPGEFIPVAEQSGLVVPMGTWVLAEACRAAAGLQGPTGGPSMSVNVAAAQLVRPAFVEDVLGALEASGLAPHRLVLEITESVVLEDLSAAVDSLERLRVLGVRIAVDDFGTGYSSLSYLADLPVDILKIDRSFVDRLAGPEEEGALVEAIVAMSRSLRLVTVGEGVEQAVQAERLQASGCALGQGYLWSPPVPLPEARRLLAGQPFVALSS